MGGHADAGACLPTGSPPTFLCSHSPTRLSLKVFGPLPCRYLNQYDTSLVHHVAPGWDRWFVMTSDIGSPDYCD